MAPSPFFNNSGNLTARLRFAAGDTPSFPMIDSRTASDRCLLSITASPLSGIESSLDKLICRLKLSDWLKRMDAPGGKVSSLNASSNLSIASHSASLYMPIAFQCATQFSATFLTILA